MKSKAYLTFFIVFLFASSSFSADVGDPSPSFSIKTIEGSAVDTRKLKDNKPMFLVFWATWCPNCLREIPKIKKIYEGFILKDIELLAINVGVNDSIEKTNRYIKKYKINYPVFFDTDSRISREFKIRGVPTVIIVDKKGIVKYRSYKMPENLESNFHRILSKSDVDINKL